MEREPKISELEKLISHFRNSGREDELLEVLKEHTLDASELIASVDEGTHEFHPEAIALNNIAAKEGLLKRSGHFWGQIKKAYKTKWYVRYGSYYIFLFLTIFAVLNLPIFVSRLNLDGDKAAPKIITTQELQETPMAASAPLDVGEVIPAASQVVIPKINVTAPIIFVDSREEKTIQANLSNGVVHYAGTAQPGEVGNAFITGHSSNYWWVKGSYNYIFVNLDKMQIGDQAKVYHNGKKIVYQVAEKRVVAPEDLSVLNQTDTPTLTLMTCTPPGTNWKRLIVKLDQVAPRYEKPRLVEKQVTIEEPNNKGLRLPSTDSGTIGGLAAKAWESIVNIFN